MACWFLANLAWDDYFQVCLLLISHSLQPVSFSSLVFVDSWMIFGWLGVSMLISLYLMFFFVEDPFSSNSASPWDICNLILIFIWYSFDFTHPHMSSLINVWNEACMNSFCSYCLHSVLLSILFLVPIPGNKELQRIIFSRRVLGEHPGTKMTCSSG